MVKDWKMGDSVTKTIQTRSLYDYFSSSYSQNCLNQSKISFLYISIPKIILKRLLYFSNILDLQCFHMLQTKSLYRYFSWRYSQNRLNQSKSSYLFISVSMVTLYQILFTKILDFIRFHILPTRSIYHYFSWSYSQNRLNQSKCSFLFILVSMVTLHLILFLRGGGLGSLAGGGGRGPPTPVQTELSRSFVTL